MVTPSYHMWPFRVSSNWRQKQKALLNVFCKSFDPANTSLLFHRAQTCAGWSFATHSAVMLFSGLRGISSSLVPAWTLSWLAVPTIFPVTLEEDTKGHPLKWCSWFLYLNPTFDTLEMLDVALDFRLEFARFSAWTNISYITHDKWCCATWMISCLFQIAGLWFVLWGAFPFCLCNYIHVMQYLIILKYLPSLLRSQYLHYTVWSNLQCSDDNTWVKDWIIFSTSVNPCEVILLL